MRIPPQPPFVTFFLALNWLLTIRVDMAVRGERTARAFVLRVSAELRTRWHKRAILLVHFCAGWLMSLSGLEERRVGVQRV